MDRLANHLLRPQHWCVEQMRIIFSPISSTQNKVTSILVRVAVFVPLVFATLAALLLGSVGLCLKGCVRNPKLKSDSAANQPAAEIVTHTTTVLSSPLPTVTIASTISTTPTNTQKIDGESKLASDGDTFNWELIPVVRNPGHFASISHRRDVFITRTVPVNYRNHFPHGIVVKIGTHANRGESGAVWPHAEEVAYRICKLLQWDVIPKTKIIHTSLLQAEVPTKYKKYAEIIRFLPQNFPLATCTFQAYKEGVTLEAISKDQNIPKVAKRSFQQAYLINMILARGDARAINTVYNETTGELFEVDNEFLGNEGGYTSGGLSRFRIQREEEVEKDLVEQVSQLPLSELQAIREKYKVKDEALLAQWRDEGDMGVDIDIFWDRIYTSLFTVKQACFNLKRGAGPITISTLASETSKVRRKFRVEFATIRESLGHEQIAQLPKLRMEFAMKKEASLMQEAG